MYLEPRKKWRWDSWRKWRLRYYAKLTIIIPEEPTLPDLELEYVKHGLAGTPMGYTVSAFTRGGLSKLKRKAEREAGVG